MENGEQCRMVGEGGKGIRRDFCNAAEFCLVSISPSTSMRTNFDQKIYYKKHYRQKYSLYMISV